MDEINTKYDGINNSKYRINNTGLSSGLGAATSPLSKSSEIDQEISNAGANSSEIDILLSNLENKLSPIIRSQYEKDSGLASPVPSRETVLGKSLQEINMSLGYRINRMKDIINRIEL